MAITTSWFLPNRVIIAQIEGDITALDIAEHNQEITSLIRAGDSQVYVIVSTEHMGHFPTSITQFKQMVSYLGEPKLRAIVVIGTVNVLARFMASALTQVARIELKLVGDMDEAIAFLNRLDQKLGLSKTLS